MAASEQAATRKDTKIPIASLNPFRKVDRPASIEAIITLIWPFTSANGKAAFLCAEPDFRLRRDKGQVRVQFSKDAAKAVATSGVGIGDTIRLSLAGARWTQHDHATKTPGRSVEGEMLFNRQLRLRVSTNPSLGFLLELCQHVQGMERRSRISEHRHRCPSFPHSTTDPATNDAKPSVSPSTKTSYST